MKTLLRLSLVVLLLVTSVALGAARGQLRVGEELVLCTGSAVIVVTRPDSSGGHAHYCPDMAAGLLVALDVPPVTPDLARIGGRNASFPTARLPALADRLVPQARGPPAAVLV